MPAKLLYQLDTDAQPSVFDSVVAYDGGADHVIGLANVTAATVPAMAEGAIYTRGPKEKQFTAFFIGGSRLADGEAVLDAARAKFFGKFRVSLMLDSNGCNTTAAAAVASLAKVGPIAGARALVVAGTGPVGMRAAAMLALEGASVTITGREAAKTEAAAHAIGNRFGVTIGFAAAPDAESRNSCVKDADILLAAGAAAQPLVDEHAWRDSLTVMRIADLNPEPPAGVGGVEPSDKARDHDGKLTFGALGIGGLKLRLHRACIARLFERNDLVLDAQDILAIAKEMA